ncbi:MAG: hypothetical protein CME60_03660 [Halobacteriovoraceae bacterium]|nr:hypothetical protein [Halobacteriovoraceae bacterium]
MPYYLFSLAPSPVPQPLSLNRDLSKRVKIKPFFLFTLFTLLMALLQLSTLSSAYALQPSDLQQKEPTEVEKARVPVELDENEKKLKLYEDQQEQINQRQRVQKYQYTYIDRKHSLSESLKLISAMYGVTWLVYPLSQPTVFREKGSWKNYKRNFGKLVFDQDEPFWNWFVHPISGSQLYLFYRANGYSRINAMGMAFISSALFEFTVEIYTEPASVQDLYQTPVLGAILGVGIENLSLYLLQTGNSFGRVLGHIINPSTLFWFYEGKIQIVPQTNFKGMNGLLMTMEF